MAAVRRQTTTPTAQSSPIPSPTFTTTTNSVGSPPSSTSLGATSSTSSPTSSTSQGTTTWVAHYSYSLATPVASRSPAEWQSAGSPFTFRRTDSHGTTLHLYTTAFSGASTGPTEPPGAFTSYPASQAVQKANGGLSSAEGAGIGIGSAVLGALIAFAIFFVCFRRKAKQGTRARHRSKALPSGGESYGMVDTKTTAVTMAGTTFAIPRDTAAAIVYNHKPQPKDDNSITDEFSRLKSRIDGHVTTYYPRSGGNEKGALNAFAHLWIGQSPLPLNRLPNLLADSRSRAHVLRAAIAWVITERMFPGGNIGQSFIPTPVASAYADLFSNRMDQQTRSAFLSEWRVMTAALSSTLHGQDVVTSDDSRLASIQSALRQADQFLAPLANSATNDARLKNLEEILKRAARLSWTLFSQPAEYQVDWSDEDRGGVVAWPAFEKTTDDNGKALRHPRIFSQKEIVTA